jgi:hypothetical protein
MGLHPRGHREGSKWDCACGKDAVIMAPEKPRPPRKWTRPSYTLLASTPQSFSMGSANFGTRGVPFNRLAVCREIDSRRVREIQKKRRLGCL